MSSQNAFQFSVYLFIYFIYLFLLKSSFVSFTPTYSWMSTNTKRHSNHRGRLGGNSFNRNKTFYEEIQTFLFIKCPITKLVKYFKVANIIFVLQLFHFTKSVDVNSTLLHLNNAGYTNKSNKLSIRATSNRCPI